MHSLKLSVIARSSDNSTAAKKAHRPQVCLFAAYTCFCVCILSICSDVQRNPRPTVEMFANLQKGQSQILKELSNIRERVATTKLSVNTLRNQSQEVDQLLKDICEKCFQIEELKNTIISLENLVKARKMADIEDRNRRCNLLIRGIEASK